MHLFDQSGALVDLDYFRFNLTPGEGREILPGETVKFAAEVPSVFSRQIPAAMRSGQRGCVLV